MKIEVVFAIFSMLILPSLQNICGNSTFNSELVVRVGGGSTIERGEWPFIAALFRKGTGEYFCGGTLISLKHVITAAHCVQQKYHDKPLEPSDVLVHLGRYNISKKSEVGSTISNVAEITIHPEWDPFTNNYDADIAVLQLETLQETSDFIKVVCWPDQDKIKVDEGIVVGWGFSENTNFSRAEDIAKQATLTPVSNEFCFLHRRHFTILSSNRTFCAGGDGVSPCSGDSGGGFFIKSGSNWFLRGIVSSSLVDTNGKCDVSNYAVFTNVVKYKSFVQQAVEKKITTRERFEGTLFEGDSLAFHEDLIENFHLNGSMEAAVSTRFEKP